MCLLSIYWSRWTESKPERLIACEPGESEEGRKIRFVGDKGDTLEFDQP